MGLIDGVQGWLSQGTEREVVKTMNVPHVQDGSVMTAEAGTEYAEFLSAFPLDEVVVVAMRERRAHRFARDWRLDTNPATYRTIQRVIPAEVIRE